MSKKTIIAGLFIVFFWSCKNQKTDLKYAKSISMESNSDSTAKKTSPLIIMAKQAEIIPDTTINNKLKLDNYSSIELFTRDYKSIKTIEDVRESPIAAFLNSNGKEYLFAYHYEGNTKNSFSLFEVGYVKDIKQKIEFNSVDERIFETENGIRLGLSLKNLIDIKGDEYKLSIEKDSIITYRINGDSNSNFLNRYGMPGYFIECRIKNAMISSLRFGFDYP